MVMTFWTIGTAFPVDSSFYSITLDSSAYVRSRICPELLASEGIDEVADSIEVIVIKPYKPLGLDAVYLLR